MPEASQPRLVGRETELRRLLALLDDAAAGRPVVALVSGDAGVGKTRLVTELSEAARGRGFAVLTGRCARPAGALARLSSCGSRRPGVSHPPGIMEACRNHRNH
ncbi:MAG: ATP-binding protein, partial [Streptosporangiaceae bacterium]